LSVAAAQRAGAQHGERGSRGAGARATVDGYFELLADTLLGFSLPAYRPGLKVREAARSKFYWLDPGVARACAGLLRDPLSLDWRGVALETLLFHELRVWNAVAQRHRPIAYYRTAAGAEIDFVIETRKRQASQRPHLVCIEVSTRALGRKWERACGNGGRGKRKVDE
jgi:predicted AAA+ superfamily ATPase